MNIQNVLTSKVKEAVENLFGAVLPSVEFQPTRKDFEGDITAVVFPILRYVKGNPEHIGKQIGSFLEKEVKEVSGFNVVKGFLNISISDSFYLDFFEEIREVEDYGRVKELDKDAVMVEYSSPNTNKPLHLGHIRNNLLGYSVAEILKASGKKVYKTQIINDRGIHICKSMLAWQKWGNGATPESTGLKGDKLVGNYYVAFEVEFKKQLRERFNRLASKVQDELRIQERYDLYEAIKNVDLDEGYYSGLGSAIKEFYKFDCLVSEQQLIPTPEFPFYSSLDYALLNTTDYPNLNTSRAKFLQGFKQLYGIDGEQDIVSEKNLRKIRSLLDEKFAPFVEVLKEAQEMLRKWEAGDPDVVALWKKMNAWVYEGFNTTYTDLGVDFDQLYYESDTYLLGKDVVADGLKKGVFYTKEDGSVWIDLTDEGLDEKIVLRADGTAVYMTQDIGTAIQRVTDYPDIGGMVYTVGNEQDYHFKVLFLILKKLGFSWSKNLHHLSYGMVDLPSGKMKSREGTVVDADDLMLEMSAEARRICEELGKLEGFSHEEKRELHRIVGLAALKYYILKVDPKKRILFDPEESVDFQGNTGPFIQYTYARIQSILRKADFDYTDGAKHMTSIHPKEKELLKQLQVFPETVQLAAEQYSPALIANYTYDLVKQYNSYYQSVPILPEVDLEKKAFRVQLSKKVGDVIRSAFKLLGIEVPQRM
ncbi:arginine--tRNA ligase [Spongiimicrobium sp. 2-473A-2-J]|uniref:arginine--tRNA ligase n=1 Tax=Eudoraea algarum TaxID=3417568 RepID=UPI003D35B29B